MQLEELIQRLTDTKQQTGNVEVKMEVLGSSVPVTDVEYEGSDEESLTVLIK